MRFFYSGIRSLRELNLLRQIHAQYYLIDYFDYFKMRRWFYDIDCIVLDSGAYKMSRGKGNRTIDDYLNLALTRDFFAVIAPDVVGDNQATYQNWLYSLGFLTDRGQQLPLVPVWQYCEDITLLEYYLSIASVVGIGGLVGHFRNNDYAVLNRLGELVKAYPQRLHLFGLNWMLAYSLLQPWTYSADTTKWLCGFKTRRVIYLDRQGYLDIAPAKVLGLDLTPEQMCQISAINLREYAPPELFEIGS